MEHQNSFDRDWDWDFAKGWLRQFEKFAESGEDPNVCSDGLVNESASESARIFMVPSGLRSGSTANFIPQVLYFGPFHYVNNRDMENMKSKLIADTVRSLISTDFYGPLRGIGLREIGSEDNFFSKMLRCRKHYYGDVWYGPMPGWRCPYSRSVFFCLMMFKDASFLLCFFMDCLRYRNRYPFLKTVRDTNRLPVEGSRGGNRFQSSRLTNVLSSSQIVQVLLDIVKLENQIPLSALGELYPFFKDSDEDFKAFVINVCEIFSPFVSAGPNAVQTLELHTKDHLLHCLYEMAVSLKPDLPNKSFCHQFFPLAWIRKHWCDFICKKSEEMDDPDLESGTNLVGSAEELSKAGVKFKHFNGGIKHAFFDKSSCTLYLPRLGRDIFTDCIIANMVALEWGSSSYEDKIITSFVYLLTELIQPDTAAKDFQLLSRNGILVNLISDYLHLVDALNNLASQLPRPYYAPINDAKKEMNKIYWRGKGKILWSEFWEAYCSKPWVLVSAIAATLLLGMTAVQVFCLFSTCNK